MDVDDARMQELYDAIEDMAGNLEDAADNLDKITQIVMPGYSSKDADAYRQAARAGRKVL